MGCRVETWLLNINKMYITLHHGRTLCTCSCQDVSALYTLSQETRYRTARVQGKIWPWLPRKAHGLDLEQHLYPRNLSRTGTCCARQLGTRVASLIRAPWTLASTLSSRTHTNAPANQRRQGTQTDVKGCQGSSTNHRNSNQWEPSHHNNTTSINRQH